MHTPKNCSWIRFVVSFSLTTIISCNEIPEIQNIEPQTLLNESQDNSFNLEEFSYDYSSFRLGDWNLLFEETFEGPESPFYTYVSKQFSQNHSFKPSSNFALKGKNSGRFELRKGDSKLSSDGIRSEVLFSSSPTPEAWYSFSVYLPSNGFAKDRDNDIISQWHQGTGSPPISLRILEDRFLFRYNSSSNKITDFPLGNATKDTWHTFVFHIIHSSDSNGLVEVWRNGNKLLSKKSTNMYRRALPRWKIGLYKPTWGNKNTDTNLRILYFDNVRIGNEKAIYEEMNPKVINTKGWGPLIPEIVSFSLVNTTTNKVVNTIKEGEQINIRLLNTNRINLRANFKENFEGSCIFDLNGPKSNIFTDNSLPYSMYGESSNGQFNNNGGTPKGKYNLNYTVYAEKSRNGKVGEQKTLTFEVVDEVESTVYIPKISGFNLIRANVNQIYGPLNDGAMIDLKKTGTHKLTLQAMISSSFIGEIKFKLSGKVNKESIALKAPYTLYGYSSGDYSFGDTGLPVGEYTMQATPVIIKDGLTNIGETSKIRFTVVKDGGLVQNSSPIQNLTLIKANINSDWGPILNGSVFNSPQLGTNKLTVRANVTSSFKGRILFQLSGRLNRNSFSTSYPPFVLHNYINGNYTFGDGLPNGKYELRLTPHENINGVEVAMTTEKWVFEIK